MFEDMTPQQRAMFAMGMGLMGTKGSGGFGRAGLLGLQELETAKRQKMAEEELRQREAERKSIEAMRELQMQQVRQAMAEEAAKRQQVAQIQQAAKNNVMGPAGMAMMGGGGPSPANAALMNQIPAGTKSFNEQGFADEVMGIDPLTGLKLREEMRSRNAPMKVGGDDRLVRPNASGGYDTVLDAVPKQSEFERILSKFYAPGSPQHQRAMEAWIAKQATHAPAANMSVSYGAPVAGTANGENVFFQPPNRAGEPPQIIRDPATGQPIRPPKSASDPQDARKRVTNNLTTMSAVYEELSNLGAIVDVNKSAAGNVMARAGASGIGQEFGRAVGTKAQSLRDRINQMRPLLINDIRQASQMGARGLDSEKELEFYLQAATDPTRGIQTNRAALRVLDEAYGIGTGIQTSQEEIRRLRQEYGGNSVNGFRFLGKEE